MGVSLLGLRTLLEVSEQEVIRFLGFSECCKCEHVAVAVVVVVEASPGLLENTSFL